MKSGLILSLVLLVIVVIFGAWAETMIDTQSLRYISASHEILTLMQSGQWERAAETTEAYSAELTQTEKWLCLMINHDETEQLANALFDLRSTLLARSETDTTHACLMLENAATRLRERNTLMLENVL